MAEGKMMSDKPAPNSKMTGGGSAKYDGPTCSETSYPKGGGVKKVSLEPMSQKATTWGVGGV